jgi:hypothetical protein
MGLSAYSLSALGKQRTETTSALNAQASAETQIDGNQTVIESQSSEISDLQASASEIAASASANAAKADDVRKRELNVAGREKAVSARESSATSVEAVAESNAISDGTWTVGVDIKPDTYRTKEAVSAMCYWEITRSGTNGGDIVENDIVNGGRPTVTIRNGQDFKSERCGDWAKVS